MPRGVPSQLGGSIRYGRPPRHQVLSSLERLARAAGFDSLEDMRLAIRRRTDPPPARSGSALRALRAILGR